MLNRATLWIVAVLTAQLLSAQPIALAQAPSLPTLTTAAEWDTMDLDPEVPNPASVLGYEIGERFTRHADLVRYFETLADASDRVQLRSYGQSVQGRPLVVAVISSPANLAKLDSITATNRELATGQRVGTRALQDQPAVAWFSFNVHGNEPSGGEASMRVAHSLAAGRSGVVNAILDRAVIVIDPCLNPDGRERYVNWYQNTRGTEPLRDAQSAEHWEPWPGGRTNHYLFDLNRDWVWLVQPESQQRLPVYREFMPQLHIDHHEQEYTAPFFMGAGDTPYNANITPETRAWIDRYGTGNAQVFDGAGLLYSTRERFDYLYPGYGKVLPVYQGAVGMLIEQGGHSRAGLRIELSESRDLTLADRARNHWLIAMSNAEMTAAWRGEQLDRFGRFFAEAASDPRPLVVFINRDADPHRAKRVTDWAEAQGVRVDELASAVRVPGRRAYGTGEEVENAELPAGTLVVTSKQPMGRLVRAMFERSPEIEDADTYDVTSWSLPVAFGLDATFVEGLTTTLDLREHQVTPIEGGVIGTGTVATLVDSTSDAFPRVLASAQKRNLEARLSGNAFTLGGIGYGIGSLVVHHGLNDTADLDGFADDLASLGVVGHRVSTGLSDDGPVLGANENRAMVHTTIGLVRGEGISSLSFGATWNLIDRELNAMHATLEADRMARFDLSKYDTIVVPETRGLSSEATEALGGWVRAGGTLVTMGGASVWAENDIVGLDDEDEKADEDEDEERAALSDLSRQERDDREVEDRIPGSQMLLQVDRTHPLSAGVPTGGVPTLAESHRDIYGGVGLIKRGDTVLRTNDRTEVVARYHSTIGGAVSERNMERLANEPAITVHHSGRGKVICFADDPTFRGFQHGPMRLLINAMLAGPTIE